MSSRAVRQFRARNPNQHQLLTGLVVDRQMSLLERGAKPYMRGASPGIVEDGEGEERGRARRRTRGGKTVTWSKTLLQVSPNSHNKRDSVMVFTFLTLSIQALLTQVRSISPRPPRQAASPRPAPRSPSPWMSSPRLDSSPAWSSSPPSPMRSPSPPATAMLSSSGTVPPPFHWQPLNAVEHQVHHQQLLQPKNLNLNIDLANIQVAQSPDEVGRGQDGEGVGRGEVESEGGKGWRTIPITRLDLSLDRTGTELQNMDVS